MKLDNYVILYIKVNSKWNKDLNVRPETITLLKENTDILKKNRTCNFLDIGFDMKFLGVMSQCKSSKGKNKQEHCIKLKHLFTAKEFVNKIKIQPTE